MQAVLDVARTLCHRNVSCHTLSSHPSQPPLPTCPLCPPLQQVLDLIQQCICPDPGRRPTAEEALRRLRAA